MTKIIALITAVLTVWLSCTPFSLLFKKTDVPHRYIVIMHNTADENAFAFMKDTYGEIDPNNEIMYASGVSGPMLLTDSKELIAAKTETAFAAAIKNNIPVWFQIDDVNNSHAGYIDNCMTCEKWYENSLNVEKLAFGEDAHLARYWFNWGIWRTTPATPCLNSPTFVSFIQSQLNEGFIPVLKKYLNILKEQKKEYLFAGICVGWETKIPDFSDIPDGTVDQHGDVIQSYEQSETGYRALENLGYTAEKLAVEAKKKGISEKQLMFDLLCSVEHDYSEMISKVIFDAGVEKTKIFTHYTTGDNLNAIYKDIDFSFPYIDTAMNEYCTPGYTVGINPSTKKIRHLKAKITLSSPEQKYYGAVESYATELNESKKASERFFDRLFNSGALIAALYGFDDADTSPFYFSKDRNAPLNQTIKELVSPKTNKKLFDK